jgi:cytochrome o ubiquinol oxidase subunit IV
MKRPVEMTVNQTIWRYVRGFALSLFLTLIAFATVQLQLDGDGDAYPKTVLLVALVILALFQIMIQLIYFFHLDKESRPRLNSLAFVFMTMVVCIIGFGSIWIMSNLNYHMNSSQTDSYIHHEEVIKNSPINSSN